MKETILIVSNVTNGLFLFRRELIECLAGKYNVEIVAGDTGSVDALKALGCNVTLSPIELHGTNPLKELGLYRYYKKKITSLKPAAVLTYTVKPNIYAGMASAKLGVPYIANITGLGTAVEEKSALRKVMFFLLRRGLRKAKKVFFQNEENRDFMLGHKLVSGAWDLLPGSGVNLDRYSPLPYPEGDDINFTFISRVMKEKGIDQFVETARAVREKHPEAHFHVYGKLSGEYNSIIPALNDEGVITYHGYAGDIAAVHAASSCTVHPSYYPEGMSNVLLESAACARPVITTDRSGCRETVDDGVTGYIVPVKDSRALTEAVLEFISLTRDERREMGLAGRAKVEKEFDRKIVIDKYLKEIESEL